MRRSRHLLAARRGWLAVLLACTLAVRLLVPAGFMPQVSAGGVTLVACSGVMPAKSAMTMAGMHHGAVDHGQGGHGKAATVELPCAFAGFGPATIGSAPLGILAAAMAFTFLLAARAVPLSLPAPRSRLRPPLRAPPLPA